MLTNKSKYGLKAMVHLVGADAPILAETMARERNIPRKFLDLILLELRRAGLINGKKGKGGGYSLARPAERITVGQIIRILDGSFAPIGCTSRTEYRPCQDCPDEAACQIRDLMIDVRDQMSMVLDNTSIMALSTRMTRDQRTFP